MISREEQINKECLDMIDFTPYLLRCKTISDLMWQVEDDYNYFVVKAAMPPELNGYIFNYFNEYDLYEYLRKRYSDQFNFTSYVIEKYCIQPKT